MTERPTYGESLPARIIREQDELTAHAADAMRYMMAERPPRRPDPWLRRYWHAFRWWLAWRLDDLADWVRPW